MRRLALALGIAFSLAMWLAGFALVDLVGTWFLGEPGTVSDLGYGALGGIVVPAGFLRPGCDSRPAAGAGALAAVASVPLLVYGIHMAPNFADGIPPYDSHVGLDQWTGLAALAFALPLVTLCGRLGALSAAAAAGVFGMGSFVYPDKPGSAGLGWGVATLVWAAAVGLAAWGGRRPASATAIPAEVTGPA